MTELLPLYVGKEVLVEREYGPNCAPAMLPVDSPIQDADQMAGAGRIAQEPESLTDLIFRVAAKKDRRAFEQARGVAKGQLRVPLRIP